MVRSFLLSCSLLAVCLSSGWAQPINEATPEANRSFALELFERKDFYNARIKLEKAYEDFKTNDLAWKLAMSHYRMRDYRLAERWFARVALRDRAGEYPEAQLWKARMMKMNAKYEEAIGELNDIVKSDADPDVKRKAQQELLGATLAVEGKLSPRVTLSEAGKELNTPGSEGSVFITPAGDELYYTTFDQAEQIEIKDDALPPYSKVHKATWAEDKWTKSGPLDDKVNREDYHSGNVSISPDGERMYFTRVLLKVDSMAESKVYMSAREGGGWGPAYEVTGVNGDWLAKNPCIGELFGSEVLYFSAEIPGGHGGLDIYYSRKIDNLNFTEPVNLGTVINGSGDEVTPFYRDGRLYFSSDSHISHGGQDIFRSDWDGSSWSKPENMGVGFNSATDDFCFTVSADGSKGTLLSNRPEGKSLLARTCCDDIYSFTIAPVEVELVVTVKEGEKNGLLRGVPVQLIEMTGERMGATQSVNTGGKGTSTFKLPTDRAFRIIASATGFFSDTLDFNTEGIKENVTLQKELVIMPMPRDPEFELYTTEEPIRLSNIYYDYDDDKILPDAEPQLQLLADLLTQYADMVIELSSHTDARGNDQYNQALSQRRAESAKNWIVKKGIREERIKPVGYGESAILNQCVNGVECTDEEHRFNRRTEFKIISGPTSILIEKKRLKSEEKPKETPKPNRPQRRTGDSVEMGLLPQSLIQWEETAVDFGTLKKGDLRDKVFTFKNMSQEDVTIELCNACDCMTLEWTTLPVKPGKVGRVEARFDSSKKEVGDVVNDHINVILKNTHPGTTYPIIYELNYKARITD